MTEIPEETKKKIEESKFLYSRTKYIFDFALETWYEPLKEFTMKTIFVPISLQEAELIYDICEFKKNNLSEEKEKMIKKIETNLDNALKEFNMKAFVKLSTRSPKDAIVDISNLKMKETLLELLKQSKTPNEDTIAFSNAKRICSVFTSGKEVLDLFSKSSRIREDLMKALEFPNAFQLNFIVREWSEMDASMEFRAFVFKRKLNAISQYCYLQYFQNLKSEKEKIQQLLLTEFDKFSDKITQENYIIDFCITKDGQVKIIELNPYFTDTSACLFDWRNPDDVKIIKEGPFQFRILEKEIDDPYDSFDREWRDFVEKNVNRSSNCILQ
jgi:hypothetical protein